MNIFDEKRAELERHEFMMGRERGRLAVALDLLTDSLVLVGQHGVYCVSSRSPTQPAMDLQAVLSGIEGAKSLIQSVMEELWAQRDARRSACASSEYATGGFAPGSGRSGSASFMSRQAR